MSLLVPIRSQTMNRALAPAHIFEGARNWHKQKSALSAAAGSTPCPDLPMCMKSAWRRPLARLPMHLYWASWKGAKWPSLARHGRGHRILPSELNFRANIYAMKKLGVERIISVSAVGSLKEEHKPTDYAFPTSSSTAPSIALRRSSARALWGHISFGDPVCSTVAGKP